MQIRITSSSYFSVSIYTVFRCIKGNASVYALLSKVATLGKFTELCSYCEYRGMLRLSSGAASVCDAADSAAERARCR